MAVRLPMLFQSAPLVLLLLHHSLCDVPVITQINPNDGLESDLDSPLHEVVVDAGDHVVLMCSGDHFVQWEFELDVDKAGIDWKSRYRLESEEILPDDSHPYKTKLTIEESVYNDTGRLMCRDEEGGEAETYLFVWDEQHLFRNDDVLVHVNIPPEGPSPVGCRPTNPQVEVSIENPYGDDITSDLGSHKLEFSRQDGLWVTEPVLQYHAGAYKCIASFNNIKKEIWLVLNINFDMHLPLPLPTISVDPPAPVVGSNVNMICTIIVPVNYMATDLEWGIPNSNRDASSWTEGEISIAKSIAMENRKLSRTLFIPNLTEEDSGEYSCTGNHYDMQSTTAKKTINVFPPNCAIISDIKIHGDSIIKITKKVKSVKWVFSVEAIPPDRAVYTWMGPDGEEVPFQVEKRFEMNRDKSRNQVALKIDAVKNQTLIDDMGIYEFKVTIPGVENCESDPESTPISKSTELELVVEQDPVLNMTIKHHSNEFFSTEKSYDIVLRAKGHPIDLNSTKLSFYPCEDVSDCDANQVRNFGFLAAMAPIDKVKSELYHYHYETQMRLPNPKDSGSGKYEFLACRKGQSFCSPQSLDFFVSESESGFEILEYKDAEKVVVEDKGIKKYIEDDELKLYCAGSKYKYSHVMWMISPRSTLQPDWMNRSSRDTEDQDIEWDSVPPLYTSNASSKFSHIQLLSFKEIQRDNEGRFRCKGFLKESDSHDLRYIRVEVSSKEAPNVVYPYTNMNQTVMSVDIENEIAIKCAFSGRPVPEIIWLKDGDPINKTSLQEDGTVEFIQSEEALLERVYETLHIKFARDVYAGEYKCIGRNRVDEMELAVKLEVIDNSPPPLTGILIGSCSAGVFIIFIMILIWKIWVYNKKIRVLSDAELLLFNEGDIKSINPDLGVDDQADLLPYDKDVEFPRERLKLGKQLGSGAFGRVLKAEAAGLVNWEKTSIVAVKMVKPQADITYIKALMSELKIMIHLGKHLNIVNLLGACTSNLARRELLVIVEYCRFGNLQKYLMHHRNSYVNQIDPETNTINFKIGQEMMAKDEYFNGYMVPTRKGDAVDFAVARENCEDSAHYVRSASEYIDAGTAVPGAPEEYINMVSPSQERESAFTFPKKQSVRYTREPVTKQVSRERVQSISDVEKGEVLTDMTEVMMDSADTGRESYGSRTYSVGSRLSKTGPGWRSNIKGDYNRQGSEITPICTKDILCWTYQVTRGMEYLSSKKVLHGDLACRNILLAADNVIKICDFGLAKDMYKTNNYRKKTDGPLPVKWLAIECLQDRVFSTQSDIWAFGVVLWEMFSLGNTPYPGIEAGERFYDMLLKGYRMPKPHFAPRDIYKIMLDCWNSDPNKRPRFKELTDVFGDLLEEGEREHYMRLDKKMSMDNVLKESELYLEMMAPPDFQTVTSMNLGSMDDLVDPHSHLLSPSIIEEKDEDDYLAPITSLPPISPLPTQDGYLIPRSPSYNQTQESSGCSSRHPPTKLQTIGELSLVENDAYLCPNFSQEYFLPQSPEYKPVVENPLTDSQGYLITLPTLKGSPRSPRRPGGLLDPRDYFSTDVAGYSGNSDNETIKSPANGSPFASLEHQYQVGSILPTA